MNSPLGDPKGGRSPRLPSCFGDSLLAQSSPPLQCIWKDTPNCKFLSVSLQYLCVTISDKSRDVAIAARNT